MNRTDAARQGLQIYEPDQPCRNGHRRRYTSTGQCADCMSAARKTFASTQRAARMAREAIDAGLMPVVVRVHPDDLGALTELAREMCAKRQIPFRDPLAGGEEVADTVAATLATYTPPALRRIQPVEIITDAQWGPLWGLVRDLANARLENPIDLDAIRLPSGGIQATATIHPGDAQAFDAGMSQIRRKEGST